MEPYPINSDTCTNVTPQVQVSTTPTLIASESTALGPVVGPNVESPADVSVSHTVRLKWITPNTETMIIEIAKVSSDNTNTSKGLIRYLINNNHWSPFEMAYVCIEITCSRAIARQLLRHRSFTFQEFSQRYQTVSVFGEPIFTHARSQDSKNRQNSIDNVPQHLQDEWQLKQRELWDQTKSTYDWALKNGIAKEVARSILPEGNTPTRLYMCGPIRSWIHYIDTRSGNGTQREHMEIAHSCRDLLKQHLPLVSAALKW